MIALRPSFPAKPRRCEGVIIVCNQRHILTSLKEGKLDCKQVNKSVESNL